MKYKNESDHNNDCYTNKEGEFQTKSLSIDNSVINLSDDL